VPGPTSERVRAASAAWVFLPDGAPRVATEEYLLVRYPDWFERPVQLVRFDPRRDAPVALAEVVDLARRLVDPGRPATSQVACWVRLGAVDAMERVEASYRGAGGVLDETVDVLALDLGGLDPQTLAPARDVELRWSDDLAVMIDAAELGAKVFGGSAGDRAALAAQHPGELAKLRSGGGGAVVAYLDGRPVGSGGLTVVGADARFWGGAVLPDARGRGVYRALLAARLRYALDHGATLALVKGRVQTSGPILRRAGFTGHGQERSWLISLS
jgi:GNAT superfamily N-acetyltransferase